MSLIFSDTTYLLLATIGLLIGAFIAFLIMTRWKTGVIIVFACLYTEDVIRRLLYPYLGLAPQFLLIKDIFLLLTYSSFFLKLVTHRYLKPGLLPLPFMPGLVLFFISILVSIIPVLLLSPIVPLLGFRSVFWYIPLVFIGYHMFEQDESTEKFLRVLAYTAIPLTMFAILQFTLQDVDSVLLKPLEGVQVDRVFINEEGRRGSIARTSSVFGSPLRFAAFSMFLFFVSIAIQTASKRRELLLLIATVMAAGGILISGQRIAIVLFFLSLGWFLLDLYWTSIRKKLSVLAVRLSIAAIFLLTSAIVLFSFSEEMRGWIINSTNSEANSRMTWVVGQMKKIEDYPALGQGLGFFALGSKYISTVTHGDIPSKHIEAGILKLWVEIGLPGLMAFGFFIMQVFIGLRKMKALATSFLQVTISVAAFVYLASILVWFSFFHVSAGSDPTSLIPLWFLVGVAFRPWKAWQNQDCQSTQGTQVLQSQDNPLPIVLKSGL